MVLLLQYIAVCIYYTFLRCALAAFAMLVLQYHNIEDVQRVAVWTPNVGERSGAFFGGEVT